MRSQTLRPPATFPGANWQWLSAWIARYAAQRRLERDERALAEMSLHMLRDIGAPEALLQRRQRHDELQRLDLRVWMHLRG